jgi:zinc/manganese transport system substrate-binding protein
MILKTNGNYSHYTKDLGSMHITKESKASGIPWMTLVIVSVVAVIATACGTAESVDDTADPGQGGPAVTIVATTTIWGDVARNVAGDDADVEVLMPIGVDPHDFQASSSQVAALYAADLVVANGLGLEEGLGDILEAAEDDGVNVLEVAPLLDPIAFGTHGDDDEGDHDGDEHEACDPTLGHADDHDDEDGHDEDGHDEDGHDEDGHDEDARTDHEHAAASCDPHVWMDPLRVAEGARMIAAALAEIAPEVDWIARADAYASSLTEEDEMIVAVLSGVDEDDRIMVTNHDAFGYFADRYGFEVVGIVIPGGSTLGDPSSRELAELVETMEAEGVTAIFVETTQPSVLAEAVAAELGGDVDVVELYTGSLGEPGSGADTVIGMLTTNADGIAEALS